MVAERARAKTVMAALDRRFSILDFVGQSWAAWIDKADISPLEGSFLEECSKSVKKRMETMTLRKEDMPIYGHCPAHDDFFLVVCSHCGQVVKPQAFEKHCERQHGSFSKLYGTLSNCSPDRPQQGSLCESHDCRHQGAGPPPPRSPHQGRSKPQHEGPSLQQVDKIFQGSPPSPPHFSTPSHRDPSWHREPTPPKVTQPAKKPLQKCLNAHNPMHGPGTYSRTYKKAHKKVCDLDKHCGVMDPERKKLCTRLLTCNIHSIHQRRQVVGRSKAFDQLVMELKMSSKSRERPPLPREVPDGGSTYPDCPGSQSGPLHYKRQMANSSVLRSVTPSESVVELEKRVMWCEETQVESHSAELSSEESDGENREELAHLPASTWHPRPLGQCTFGARVLGCSVLAFDRRLLHLRSAFSVMMEQHLSTYLWKKIPQVSELCSHPATTNTCNSHIAKRSSVPAPKTTSLRTSTSGQSEPQPSHLTAPSKLPTKVQSASGPSRPRVGRPNKQTLQAKFRELQESPTASKRRKFHKEDEDSNAQVKMLYTPNHRDHHSAKTTVSSLHGPINGVLSPGSKPRPSVYATEMKGLIKQSPTHISASPSPESDKGGASGLNQRAVGYEHKGPGRKRKTTGASPSKNLTCAPKPNVLSSFSQTHSNLVSWGGDGRPGSTSHTPPKKLGAQKPKLLH